MTTERSTRERVAGYVREDPGVHFNELVRALDIAPGQAQYHLRRLRQAGEVTGADLFGRTHYYPPAYDPWERRALALVRRETAAEIVGVLLESPARPDEVAEAVGIARSTLSWHVSRLVDAGVVEKRRDARNRVTLAATRPEETARLLDRADPTLPERLVDRFARLVDSLLAE